ncbi:magnesium-dependent phosphatase-1 [Paraphysoderma sedebokerense]|nr:magnesium-dependent phosphatase-1 [Paraphysoderma sedebokerense]KAI9141314.1 magnesium-dependent phosphatase-1 [Paraphysoderma sedebokerense]
MPKVIVFDIDYTLWPLWIDTHSSGPPFKQNDSGNGVLDRSNYLIQFYPHVPMILNYLRNEFPEIKLCLASRTNEPKWTRAVLELITISTDQPSARTSSHSSPKRAISYFPYQEIYPGSKLTHFRQLSSKTKEDFETMLFFDDEYRNIKEVSSLGVSCWHVDEDIGVNIDVFLKGIELYLSSRPSNKS